MRTRELGPQGCLSWFENIKKKCILDEANERISFHLLEGVKDARKNS